MDSDLLCHWPWNETIFPCTFPLHYKKNAPLLAQERAKNYTICTTNRFVSISVILSSLPLSPFYVFFQSNEVV